jgi:hypothetical protein
VSAIAISSAGIELVQRHLPGRLPDVTDVIVAALGVGFGFVAATRGAAWYRRLVE